LKEIRLDMEYFGRSYTKAKIKYNIGGSDALQAANGLKEQLFAEV
jgi:hypothetical protein